MGGPAGRLQQFLKQREEDQTKGERAADGQIIRAHLQNDRVRGLRGNIRARSEQTEQQTRGIDHDPQEHGVSRDAAGLFRIALAQELRQHPAHAHAGADRDRHHHHLDRKCQRYGVQCLLSVRRHVSDKSAVDDNIKRLQHHGENDREPHRKDLPVCAHLFFSFFVRPLLHLLRSSNEKHANPDCFGSTRQAAYLMFILAFRGTFLNPNIMIIFMTFEKIFSKTDSGAPESSHRPLRSHS